jgi:shikimate kinase
VVFLETSVAQQVERVKQGRTRPLLSNVDTGAKLSQLTAERTPLYRGVADVIVPTDGRKVRSVAEDILRELYTARSVR